MAPWTTLLGRAGVSGSTAAITSSLALAALAAAEGRGPLQPVNATSHWLHGPAAARVRNADVTHTGVGYATHHAATFFWAVLFEASIGRRRSPSPLSVVRDAVVVSGIAAATDYGATPKRFTPGWEFVLSKRSMAITYAAMAAGLALGGLAASRPSPRQGGRPY